MEKRFAEIGNETEKQISLSKTRILDSCANLQRLQYPDVEELKNILSEKIDTVKNALDAYFEDHGSFELIQYSWQGTDHLDLLVDTMPVMPEPTQKEIYAWCDEGEQRYKKEIPPGFKDAKKKDGVRKYSDLIIWKEILRFAEKNKKDIIFVTDDVKADWWDNQGFHSKLLDEFKKTGQSIEPLKSKELLSNVATDYDIKRTDAIEIALRMTDDDYCEKIEERVFDEASIELVYGAADYIDTESSSIGSEGIDEFEITEHEFLSGERVGRDENLVIYKFTYRVVLGGTSYDYWGRDEDTKEVICSDGRHHVFEGKIAVRVSREAEVFYDFETDDSYEKAVIYGGKFEEIDAYNLMEQTYGEFGNCPYCGAPLNIENDAGNGFCLTCTRNEDVD